MSASKDAQGSGRRNTKKAAAKSAQLSDSLRRDRVLDAIIELVSEGSYATTTVAQISARGKVSTATYYALFSDKEDGFLAAYRRAAGELVRDLERRIRGARDLSAWEAMLDGVFDLAANGPGMLRLLVDEPTLATRNALAARDRLLAEIESTIERDRPTAQGSAHPDIPAKVLVGATLRLMLARLRENDRSLGELRGGLGRWVECYKHTGEPRRQTLAPVAGMRAGPPDYAAGLSEPQRPGRGRSRLTAEQTASNQRERLMYATALVTADKGYTESTVADIVAAAGLAREVFYRHFADRQDAFMSAYDTGFQALMALSVGAFYTSGDWPERIWAALGVYTDFMVNFPAFASLGMVESHTIAPEVVGRVDERVMAFTVFLEEGRRELQEDPGVAAVICEAIAMAIYEITSHTIRNGRGSELPGLLPLIAYVALAPFTGTDAANELIERKVRESREPRAIERRRGDLADRDRAR